MSSTEPQKTVADVIESSRTTSLAPGNTGRGARETYQIPAPSQAQIREAHRASRLDGEISDREPLEVGDVIRAASALERA